MYHTDERSLSGNTYDLTRNTTEPDAFFRRLTQKYQDQVSSTPRSGVRIRTTDLYTAEHMREERLWRKDAIARHLAAAN